MIIKNKPTDINMALGSVCYTRFDGDCCIDLYHHNKDKKCTNGKVPLVFMFVNLRNKKSKKK
jgi:hypothetical protein